MPLSMEIHVRNVARYVWMIKGQYDCPFRERKKVNARASVLLCNSNFCKWLCARFERGSRFFLYPHLEWRLEKKSISELWRGGHPQVVPVWQKDYNIAP